MDVDGPPVAHHRPHAHRARRADKQDTPRRHGSPLGEEEVRLTKEAYGWPTEPALLRPRGRAGALPRVHRARREWVARWQARSGGWSGFDRCTTAGHDARRSRRATARPSRPARPAPRSASGRPSRAPSRRRLGRPRAVDAAGRSRRRDVERGAYDGRNLHFGIREHAMGAPSTGSSSAGCAPSARRFLIFSDYMKASIRLASLMRIPSIFVFTHDSIGLGEDGPTHQPIEQLASLRAQPNLYVVRPADANETVLGLSLRPRADQTPTASSSRARRCPSGPADVPRRRSSAAATSCTRPSAPLPDRSSSPAARRCSCACRPPPCCAARESRPRLVSMPCMERFAEQDRSYRHEVLLPGVPRSRLRRGPQPHAVAALRR
jgi:transketolase